MYRINLVDPELHTPTGTWFDRDRAQAVYDDTHTFDGSNYISRATGSQWQDETLFHTASGRWVLCHTSRYGDNTSPWYYEIPEEEAHTWLLRCGYEEAIPAPALAARDLDRTGPTPARTIRIADDLWQAAQERARAEGGDVSRLVRSLLTAYLAQPADPVVGR